MRRLLLVFVMLTAGCVTSGTTDVAPPASCDGAANVAGTWRDHRMSQLGPARVTLTLRCDCTFDATIQGLFMRVKQNGTVDATTLQFGESTRWPFALEGETLVLHEAGERHEFARVSKRNCVTSSARTSSSATSPR